MDTILYHRNCPDGWCAAYIASKRYPEAALYGVTYGEAFPPDFADRVNLKDVLIVDFSWSRGTTIEIANRASSLTIYDHHQTAEAELRGLEASDMHIVFDLSRSGAAITWDELNPPNRSVDWDVVTGRPWYVNYVQDRDLWRWELPDSREVNAYLMALPQTTEAWDKLAYLQRDHAVELGRAIRLHIDHYIEKIVAQASQGRITYGVGGSVQLPGIESHAAWVVNAPYLNISEVCHELCLREPSGVGIGWFERADAKMQFSLRSIGEIDVGAIAKSWGGGGHKNAAGFELPITEGRRLLDSILGRWAKETQYGRHL